MNDLDFTGMSIAERNAFTVGELMAPLLNPDWREGNLDIDYWTGPRPDLTWPEAVLWPPRQPGGGGGGWCTHRQDQTAHRAWALRHLHA